MQKLILQGLNPGLASLKPLKHLSLSPREAGSSSTSKYAGELHWSSQSHYLSQNTCRNFKEPSKGVVEQEVRSHKTVELMFHIDG